MISLMCGKVRFSFVLTVFAALSFSPLCRAAELQLDPAEQEKARVLREVALNWIHVGQTQSERGFYLQAEKSLLTAQNYREYLTGPEHAELNDHLQKAHEKALQREAILQHVRRARELVKQGQPIKARAHFEKVRDSNLLTDQERQLISKELKTIDQHFDAQRDEVTELYDRSVELFRAGQLEKAREGFLEVSKYGLLVAPEGETPEDYLVEIDSILTERLQHLLPADNVPTNRFPEFTRPDPDINLPPTDQPQETDVEEQLLVEDAPAESLPELPAELPTDANEAPTEQLDARTKIIRSYTEAIVEDTVEKVAGYLDTGRFEEAVKAVRKAAELVNENRLYLGDYLFRQHTIRLQQLTDQVLKAQNQP